MLMETVNKVLDLAKEIDEGLKTDAPNLGALTEKLEYAKLELEEARTKLAEQNTEQDKNNNSVNELVDKLAQVDALDPSSAEILDQLAFLSEYLEVTARVIESLNETVNRVEGNAAELSSAIDGVSFEVAKRKELAERKVLLEEKVFAACKAALAKLGSSNELASTDLEAAVNAVLFEIDTLVDLLKTGLSEVDETAVDAEISEKETAISALNQQLVGLDAESNRLRGEINKIEIKPGSPDFAASIKLRRSLVEDSIPVTAGLTKITSEKLPLEERLLVVQRLKESFSALKSTVQIRGELINDLNEIYEVIVGEKDSQGEEAEDGSVDEMLGLTNNDTDSGLQVVGQNIVKIPGIESIADMRAKGTEIAPEVESMLLKLRGISGPIVGYEGLSPKELALLDKKLSRVNTGRKNSVEILLDFANVVVLTEGNEAAKAAAREVISRAKNETEYAPNDRSVLLIIGAFISNHPALITRNLPVEHIDPMGVFRAAIQGFESDRWASRYEDSITGPEMLASVSALQAMQEIDAVHRQPAQVESLLLQFDGLITSHCELILKLRSSNKRLVDFFDEEEAAELTSVISFLKSICTQMKGRTLITPAQKEKALELSVKYSTRMTANLATNEDLRAVVFTQQLQRSPTNIDLAQHELCMRLNDLKLSRKNEGRLYGSLYQYLVVNKIIVKGRLAKPVTDLGNPPRSLMTDQEGGLAITKYFSMDEQDRSDAKAAALASCESPFETAVAQDFFDILDQYLPKNGNQEQIASGS